MQKQVSLELAETERETLMRYLNRAIRSHHMYLICSPPESSEYDGKTYVEKIEKEWQDASELTGLLEETRCTLTKKQISRALVIAGNLPGSEFF